MPDWRFMVATAGGIILIILNTYLGNDMARLKTGYSLLPLLVW